MHQRVQEFCEATQARYGIAPDVHEFPEGTKTAVDAAEAIGCDVAQIASSLVVSTDAGLAVVVTSGANRLDMDRVAAALDASRATLADPDDVKGTLGWGIGGVPPFCHETSVPVLVDETLFDHDVVWAAAGTPNAVFPIAPADLCEHADGRRATVHEDC